ncbi:MAG: DUF4340 domain-containing protein [Deltaproteobacteria bacterium]|nr:DUF4340 domain-containing protein [Deltaproteobacteria bacterium]
MTKKTNLILFMLLVSQLALITLVYWPGKGKNQAATNLLPGMNPENIVEFSITDEAGKTLAMKREDQGEWQVSDGKGTAYPADAERMQGVLATMTSLQSQRLVTRTPSSHIRLQVDDKIFAKKLAVTGKNGETQTLIIGSSPGPQTVHVRPTAANDVYLAKGLTVSELDTETESWWRKDYVLVDREKLKEIKLENSHGSLTLQKEGDKWRLAGDDAQQELAGAPVDTFLQRATHLVVTRYLGKEHQGKPLDAAVLTLTTDQETITVTIGPEEKKDKNDGKEADGEHVIKSSASAFFATASAYQIKPLTGMKKADLVQKDEGSEKE